jgi:GxxExxY protein
MEKERFEYLAGQVFKAALEVHKTLGPGLLESVYEFSLIKELQISGIGFQSQTKVPLFYKGYDTTKDFFIDLLIEDEIIIELKATECLAPVHQAQLLTYLKLTDKKMGSLINFNVPLLKDGFKRMVNNY